MLVDLLGGRNVRVTEDELRIPGGYFEILQHCRRGVAKVMQLDWSKAV